MENNQGYFRTRINTKQTAKGEWYIDFTTDEEHSQDAEPLERAKKHLVYLKAIESVMIEDGRKIAGMDG